MHVVKPPPHHHPDLQQVRRCGGVSKKYGSLGAVYYQVQVYFFLSAHVLHLSLIYTVRRNYSLM